ncbi:hypothetical protein [Marivivens marinus]|uniref:hypothetical protein n=1 Tax=Marivivens marinus TaxID=3110173 RepID=UPI003B848C2D
MALAAYIEGLVSGTALPRFAWEDWKCRDYYMWDPPEGFLEQVSDAAAVGLMLASGAWIAARMNRVDPDPMPDYALRAGWAFMLEPESCFYYEPNDNDWRGPVRAPMSIMAVIAMDALYCRDADPEVRIRTHWMANLARYVLEDDAETFDAWFNWAADRLARVHPRSEMPKLGLFDVPVRFEPVVGRDVFVPETDYDPATARSSLYNWLMQGDRDNPFIDFSELRP